MLLDQSLQISPSSKRIVIQCTQCGRYSFLISNKIQICVCNTLLVYQDKLQPQTNLFKDCKMCEQIVKDSLRP